MRVDEILLGQLHTIEPSATIVEAATKMKESESDALIVTVGQKLIGILTDSHILYGAVAGGHDVRDRRVWEFMSANPPVASPEMDVEDLLKLMQRHRVRRLPVVSDNKVVGLVSLADVATHLELV